MKGMFFLMVMGAFFAAAAAAVAQTTQKGVEWDGYVHGEVRAVGFRFYEVREDLARVLLKTVTLAEAPENRTELDLDLTRTTRLVMVAYSAAGIESEASNEVVIGAEQPLPPQGPRSVTFHFNADGTLNRVEVDPGP